MQATGGYTQLQTVHRSVETKGTTSFVKRKVGSLLLPDSYRKFYDLFMRFSHWNHEITQMQHEEMD